jgi:hypothetical protein
MTRSDRIALLLSLLGILASALVADRVFERMAHIEDEMAYVWQAQAIAGGRLTVPSPPEPKSFLYPFVVDYHGRRFGKYPLGWPVLLSFGVRLGIRFLVNPLLAGLGIWLTYRLGKLVFSETVGILAAALTLTSPFFLMNSGSLLSHPLGLVLSAAFALAWLDAFFTPPGSEAGESRPRLWLPALTAGAALGLLALTRPFTALAVGLPFGVHGLYLMVRGSPSTRKRLILAGGVALGMASLHFVWQYAVTGDPTLNPYTLWWDYDKIGFGPGYGHLPGGHTLRQAWINTRYSLWVGYRDLFGWGAISWLFLPVGSLLLWRNRRAALIGSVCLSLIVFYLAYWIGSSLFGPRYYYEGLYSLTILSAAGIAWLAGWPTGPGEKFPNHTGWGKARPLAVTFLVALLLSANLIFYTPMRLKMMFGLYGVQRAHLELFLTEQAQELAPALVIVHTNGSWIGYGTLLELEDPFLDTPFIFVIARGAGVDADVARDFPDRRTVYYYADQPGKLYLEPQP